MIGHSAYREDYHYDVLDMLARFSEENIIISLVLAYGDPPAYADDVEKYAVSLFGADKVEVRRKIVPFSEYLDFVASVDIWIHGARFQTGMGTLYLLLMMGKKVFLRNDTSVGKWLRQLNVGFYDVNDIPVMSYRQLIEPVSDPEDSWKKLAIIDEYLKDPGAIWQEALRKIGNLQ